jgi:hypothetical protein
MLMSGSEVLRESSVSKVVAADPADYLADQSGGNQSSINGPSRGQSSSTHFVKVLPSNTPADLLLDPSQRYDAGKTIVERTNENTQDSKEELRPFSSSLQLSNRATPRCVVIDENQEREDVVLSALELILNQAFYRIWRPQDWTATTEERAYDEVVFDAHKFEYDTKSGSQDTIHDSTKAQPNLVAMPAPPVKQEYQIDQIKEMGSADEQSR